MSLTGMSLKSLVRTLKGAVSFGVFGLSALFPFGFFDFVTLLALVRLGEPILTELWVLLALRPESLPVDRGVNGESARKPLFMYYAHVSTAF